MRKSPFQFEKMKIQHTFFLTGKIQHTNSKNVTIHTPFNEISHSWQIQLMGTVPYESQLKSKVLEYLVEAFGLASCFSGSRFTLNFTI